jgi:hypothetical protein
VEAGVQISTAIFDHGEAKISIRSFDKRRENDTTSGDTEKDERVNLDGAEDHCEVCTSERAYAMLGDDNLAFFRAYGGRDRG